MHMFGIRIVNCIIALGYVRWMNTFMHLETRSHSSNDFPLHAKKKTLVPAYAILEMRTGASMLRKTCHTSLDGANSSISLEVEKVPSEKPA